MVIRLIKSWKRFPAGHVFTAPDGVANVLIRRGFAQLAEEAPDRETAMVGAGVERAVKAKGRRRKAAG